MREQMQLAAAAASSSASSLTSSQPVRTFMCQLCGDIFFIARGDFCFCVPSVFCSVCIGPPQSAIGAASSGVGGAPMSTPIASSSSLPQFLALAIMKQLRRTFLVVVVVRCFFCFFFFFV
jgi:hypothetical protein